MLLTLNFVIVFGGGFSFLNFKVVRIMSFASRLKQAMNERNVSQVELAAQIGKGKSSVSQYISGKNVPKEDVQKQIAEVWEGVS